MKNKVKAFNFLICLCLLLGCQQSSYFLENPPAGTVFVDGSGESITEAKENSLVTLHDIENNKTLFSFYVSNDVDFTNLTVARTVNTTLVYFPSASDAIGLGDVVSFSVPCAPETSALRICADAISTDDFSEACEATNVILTRSAKESGDYFWSNTESRSGIADCEIEIAAASVNAAVQSTVVFPSYVSFQGPEGLEVDPETAPVCALACDDPNIDAGGVLAFYVCNDPRITGPTDDISGLQLSCVSTFETGEATQTFISRYLTTDTPSFLWTFVDRSNVTLDLLNYHYLLPGQQERIVQCEFQCEQYVEGEGRFEFAVNDSDILTYTVTGYDADNIYFLNPNDLNPVLAGLDAGVEGVDILVVTDGNDGTSYSFELTANDFTNVIGFEKIDFDNGVANAISLSANGILATSDVNSLIILGDEQDSVVLTDEEWLESADTLEVDGIEFRVFTKDTVEFYLQVGVTLSES